MTTLTQQIIQVLTDNETSRLYRAFPLGRDNGDNEAKLFQYCNFIKTTTKKKLTKEFESIMSCII